ncbi:recombinase zinc beta ribbon domain-containing protein [Acidobacteriota bacterium]
MSGPAREGLALLQGLLLCAKCGRKLTVRYKGNGGIYPTYECNWIRREGLSTTGCLFVRCDLLDSPIAKRIPEVMKPSEVEIALKAVQELEKRDDALSRQWNMRLERAEYEAQLAERRYMEVDPSQRLVASTLESRWNDALLNLEGIKKQYADFQQKELRATTPEQKARILALAKDFPRLWNSPTTKAKDKKRMLRLFIKDITIEKDIGTKQVVLHVRWQGGASEDIKVELPPSMPDRIRYPEQVVERVRVLAGEFPDARVAAALNKEGLISAKGKSFTVSMIKWIRYKHNIPTPQLKRSGELTVRQVADKFRVSIYTVYYWIERGIIEARKANKGSPYWITIDRRKKKELNDWVRNSTKIQKRRSEKIPKPD